MNCSNYSNQISCESDGIDGICVFNGENCSLMTKCEDANRSYTACLKKPKVCRFDFDRKNDTDITSC